MDWGVFMKRLILILCLISMVLFSFNSVQASWWNNDWKRCKNIEFNNPLDTGRIYEPVEMTINGLTLENVNEIRIINKPCGENGDIVKYVLLDGDSSQTEGNDWVKVRFEVSKPTSSEVTFSIYYDNPDAPNTVYTGINGNPYYVWGDDFNRDSLGSDWAPPIQQDGIIEIQDDYLKLYVHSPGGLNWVENKLRTAKDDFTKSSISYKLAIGYEGRTDNIFLGQVFSPGADHLYDGDSLYEEEWHCGQIYNFKLTKWVEGNEIALFDSGIMYNDLNEWHYVERTMVDDTHVNLKVDESDKGNFDIPNTGNWLGNSYFYIQGGVCILAEASSEVRYDNICIVNEDHACHVYDTSIQSSIGEEYVIPTSGMVITRDTTFYPGTYNIDKVITVAANNIQLDCNGAVLIGTGTGEGSYPDYMGIYLDNIAGTTIKNCVVTNFKYGIYVFHGSSNYLTNNVAYENKAHGISLYVTQDNVLRDNSMWGNDINLATSLSGPGSYSYEYNNDVDESNIVNGKKVIYINGKNDIVLDGVETNHITIGNGYNIVVKNIKIDNGDPILIGYSSDVEISDNQINSNFWGIVLHWTTNSLVTRNYLKNNLGDGEAGGIFLYRADDNTFTENTIDSNKYGIHYWISKDNIVYHNNFINNLYHEWDERPAGTNYWYSSSLSEGNYWDTYDTKTEGCFDLNYNGICDSPYVFSDGHDNYPFTCYNRWLDADCDGIPNIEDKCPNTVGQQIVYGCSCKQILDLKPGKDKGQDKNGCSQGTIEVFTKKIGWAKGLFS